MSEGPFRDTLTPLIEEAQRQLDALRVQRAALEDRYEKTRTRLDQKIALTKKSWPDALMRSRERSYSRPSPGVLRAAFLGGVVVGLITWVPLLRHGP